MSSLLPLLQTFSGQLPDANAYPEYPGAPLTTVTPTTPSINDPANVISMKIVYPTGEINLPVLVCLSGYHDTVASMNTGENNLERWARLGYLVLAVDVRGNASSTGTWDDAGRTTQDVYDAIQYVVTNHSSRIAPNRFSILGFSGGGGLALLLACRFPDLFQSVTDFFGISDWGSDATYGWYQQEPSRQTNLQTYIGGTPAAKPDEYAARYAKSAIATNYKGYLSMFHDTGDTSVEVNHSSRVRDEYISAGRSDYQYFQSTSGDPVRWLHAYPLAANDLHDAEIYWKDKAKTHTVKTVPTSGTLKILGMLQTKRFKIYMNDGNYLNAGRSRVGTVVYNTVANTYTVTNNSANYAVVTIVTAEGLIATGALAAADSFTFSPVSVTIDSSTPKVWFDFTTTATNLKKIMSGSDISVVCDKSGGINGQGYSLEYRGNRPALLTSDLNGFDAAEMVAASTEGFLGVRRPDLQNIANFTYIEVGTGTIVDHGQGVTAQTQFSVLVGGQAYHAISSGSTAYGNEAQSSTYLVRSVLYDGTQSTNSTRLVKREDKSAQTLSFTGTIPAATENNSSSVFGVGKRSYDGGAYSGKLVEFMIFTTTLSDIGDKEDILKAKYSI